MNNFSSYINNNKIIMIEFSFWGGDGLLGSDHILGKWGWHGDAIIWGNNAQTKMDHFIHE